MPLILEASSLSLNDVHRLLKLQKQPNGLFADFLNLEPLTDFEQQDLAGIANDFERYLYAGKVSEGLVKFLTLAPLMRLAGFYEVPIRLTMEDSIAIAIEDIDYSSGYRLYFGQIGSTIILLLCGGDKGSQQEDIFKAREYWKDYERRKNTNKY